MQTLNIFVRNIYWTVKTAFRVSPGLVITTTILTLLLALTPSSQVLLIGQMTDAAIEGSMDQAALYAVLAGIVVAGYLALQQIVFTLQRMTQIALRAEFMQRIGATLVELDPLEISKPEIQSRARAAREAVLEGKVQLVPVSTLSALYSITVTITLAITIGRNSVGAAILIVCCLVPATLASMWYAKWDSKVWPQISEARRKAAYLDDQIAYPTSAVELASLDAREKLSTVAAVHHKASRDAQFSLERQGVISDAIAGVASALFLAGAFLALIGSDAPAGALAGGAVGILSGIMATSNTGFVVGSLLSGANAVTRFRKFTPSRTADNPRRSRRDVRELRIDNLSVAYDPNGTSVIRGANLAAERGEIVAIVGANGAGKSTLIRGIAGLAATPHGEIYFDDDSVSEERFEHRHQDIGLLSQDFGRYELTVRENLMLGAVGDVPSDEAMWAALRTAKAEEFVRRLPGGLDTQLGEQWGGVGLSGGQWQRLALSRLVLRNAPIWILDEPTSAIDAEAEAEVLRELRELATDHITLFVSHRAWTLKAADRIYVVDEGAIVESGTYDTLMQADGRFSRLFATQEEITPNPTNQTDGKEVQHDEAHHEVS